MSKADPSQLSAQNREIVLRELVRHGSSFSRIVTVDGLLHLKSFGLLEAFMDAAREEGVNIAGRADHDSKDENNGA